MRMIKQVRMQWLSEAIGHPTPLGRGRRTKASTANTPMGRSSVSQPTHTQFLYYTHFLNCTHDIVFWRIRNKSHKHPQWRLLVLLYLVPSRLRVQDLRDTGRLFNVCCISLLPQVSSLAHSLIFCSFLLFLFGCRLSCLVVVVVVVDDGRCRGCVAAAHKKDTVNVNDAYVTRVYIQVR